MAARGAAAFRRIRCCCKKQARAPSIALSFSPYHSLKRANRVSTPVNTPDAAAAADPSAADLQKTVSDDAAAAEAAAPLSPAAPMPLILKLLGPTWEPYARLARVDKPIGTMLLLWPCWWSIALATPAGMLPDLKMLGLFGVGAFAMRSAGCIINDLWDKVSSYTLSTSSTDFCFIKCSPSYTAVCNTEALASLAAMPDCR
jgi:hypothetical protein